MDIVEQKIVLTELISKYLENKTSLETLQKFSWEMIEFFSDKKNKLPPYHDFEKELWYAIWQIQHLADEEHEKEGMTTKVLSEALDYLKSKKKIPEAFVGTRP